MVIMIINRVLDGVNASRTYQGMAEVVVEEKIEYIPPKRGQSFLRGRRHWLYGKYETRATTAHERENMDER